MWWCSAVLGISAFPATVQHSGHISGPGWVPINPAGNLDVDVCSRLAEGEEVALPNLGLETLHHVHADDVAQSFTAAMANRAVAVGESVHVVSSAALTLRGLAEAVAGWYSREANLAFLPWEQWRQTVSPVAAGLTWDHIATARTAASPKRPGCSTTARDTARWRQYGRPWNDSSARAPCHSLEYHQAA